MTILGLNTFRATALALGALLVQITFFPDAIQFTRRAAPTFTFQASDWPEIAQNTSSGAIAWLKSAPPFNTNGFTQDWGTIAPFQFDLDQRGNIAATPYTLACPAYGMAYDESGSCYWQCGSMKTRRVAQNLKCLRPTDAVECKSAKTVALTFDDGPSPATRTLIKFLKENNIKATFFLIGSSMVQYPDIVRELYAAGFELGVHTWSHQPLTKFSNEIVQAEILWTMKAFRDILGPTYIPRFFRPPYGDVDDRVRAIAEKAGLQNIFWNFDSFDTTIAASSLATVSDNFRSALTASSLATSFPNGLIELHHDSTIQSVDFFTKVAFPHLSSLGVSFSALSSCVSQPASQADTYIDAPAAPVSGSVSGAVTDANIGMGTDMGTGADNDAGDNLGTGTGAAGGANSVPTSGPAVTMATKASLPTPDVPIVKTNGANVARPLSLGMFAAAVFGVLFA